MRGTLPRLFSNFSDVGKVTLINDLLLFFFFGKNKMKLFGTFQLKEVFSFVKFVDRLFNPLRTKRICVIQGLSPYRAENTLHFGYKNPIR